MSQKSADHEMADLEERLQALGRLELQAENRIQILRKEAREEGQAGRFEASDAAWALLERTRASLEQTRALIMTIETRLYSLRRQKRH